VKQLIESVAAAIIRQENMKPDYHNPMNLRDAPWLPFVQRQYVNLGHAGSFWAPASRKQGIAGGMHLIALRIASGYSLKTLVYSWAPPVENNSGAYLANVSRWTGITDTESPLLNLIEEPSLADLPGGRNPQPAPTPPAA
jgi:hypothetical protein